MVFVDQENIIKRERIFALALLTFIALFTAFDIFEDYHEGSSVTHMVSEIIVVVACLSVSTYLWRRVLGAWKDQTSRYGDALTAARGEAKKWQEANASLTEGLSAAIDRQMDEWGLSAAQKDISFLLLKGLSFKEISEIRQTTEHTVRQQAGTIYRKSGVDGRAQLSAYFLEDLFPKH